MKDIRVQVTKRLGVTISADLNAVEENELANMSIARITRVASEGAELAKLMTTREEITLKNGALALTSLIENVEDGVEIEVIAVNRIVK